MPEMSGGSDVARRCSLCGISWPREFPKCYECGGTTDIYRGTPTLTMEEAKHKKNHFLFQEYLERTGRS